MTERIYAGWVKVPMKPITRSVMALVLATSWTPFNLWAQQKAKRNCLSKHVSRSIRLKKLHWLELSMARLRALRLKKKTEDPIPGRSTSRSRAKRDLTEVWVEATTGKITSVDVETPLTEKKEVAGE